MNELALPPPLKSNGHPSLHCTDEETTVHQEVQACLAGRDLAQVPGYEAAAGAAPAHPSTTKQSSLPAQLRETRSPTQRGTLSTSPGLPQNLSGLWAHGTGALGLKEALDP